MREKYVDFKDWLQYMMYRSDGVPAAHPSFAIVAMNHKMKNQLQGQGQYALNTSGMDPNLTGEKLIEMWDDEKSGRKELFNRLHRFTSNVTGTDGYWLSKRFTFRSTIFWNKYIRNRNISLFHTGSVAEFHEPWLRILLYSYVKHLNSPIITEEYAEQSLNDVDVNHDIGFLYCFFQCIILPLVLANQPCSLS